MKAFVPDTARPELKINLTIMISIKILFLGEQIKSKINERYIE
jgi:hypothetical protein